MKKIEFTKIVASGNDFIIIDNINEQVTNGQAIKWSHIAKHITERKNGIGSDGLLLLEKSKKADLKMRIFNPDGSEVTMCGNGSRCVALYCGKKHLKIETKAGILYAELSSSNKVKIKMTDPTNLKTNIEIRLNGKNEKVSYINTGVPHIVYFIDDLDTFNVKKIGKLIRYHDEFRPEGTNVNFVKIVDRDSIKVRTYERGVEDETLACGTGACASAIMVSLKKDIPSPVNVYTKSGEMLKIYFERKKEAINNLYLEGEVRKVYQGSFMIGGEYV